MKSSELWARVKRLGAHGLRRGAWYPVVNEVTAEMLVVDVAKQNVPVPRQLVDVSERAPGRWSIVSRNSAEPGAERINAAGHPLEYAVCPGCRSRVPFGPGRPEEMQCPNCQRRYPVDWDDRC
ncbi:MAG: hypothetical protein IH616_05410 [Gemmatimonadales bacterium]|nr:hypothetical protein [Gemmatimonadales bacterium]